jgi:hypothetical protein
MPEYASRGVGNAALTTGIIGTSGFGLNLLSNLLTGMAGNGCCNSDNMAVNRYEAAQSARIAELETEVKLRDANTYTLGEVGKLRDYMERRIDRVENELSDQRVYNATNTAALSCIGNQVNQIMSMFQLKIPNSSVCPGWGNVTVGITPTTTAG